ncbi:MAG: hypothetical protein VXY14_08020 [Candidatus Thermoplasmatota archaeon]|nr:hypothetical protein [Candidatus Thermoplasmatota archaeon]
MEGMTYLAVAYLGMLVAIALWTWTVVQRSRRLDQRLHALEGVAGVDDQPGKSDGEAEHKA